MKRTFEIDDELIRRARAPAIERGISLDAFVSEALADKLNVQAFKEKPWMQGFGDLRDLHEETLRIDRIINEEFGLIEPEGWK